MPNLVAVDQTALPYVLQPQHYLGGVTQLEKSLVLSKLCRLGSRRSVSELEVLGHNRS